MRVVRALVAAAALGAAGPAVAQAPSDTPGLRDGLFNTKLYTAPSGVEYVVSQYGEMALSSSQEPVDAAIARCGVASYLAHTDQIFYYERPLPANETQVYWRVFLHRSKIWKNPGPRRSVEDLLVLCGVKRVQFIDVENAE